MTDALYPPSPVLADTAFLEPSSQFKSKTYRMIFGITLFALLYILLIAFGVGVLIGAGTLAIGLVTLYPSTITFLAALGLLGLGVMFCFFTIKFIFAKTKEEDPMEIEITEKDQPVLFDFIRKLSNEVGTMFPKRILLVSDVNASVSYNSSFWSMFFPVRKNLRIGLGLVNALNVSEFKATLAHEFGHFSQRSMKTGSYVYTANKIIFNLAYQYDRFDDLLNNWRSAGGILGIFAGLTNFFVEMVRSILRSSYGALNKNYLALSREMEYHADLVACSAAGNDAMINTLRKIEFADNCYQAMIRDLESLASKKQRQSTDVYGFHSRIMIQSATFSKLEIRNGLIYITADDINRNFMKSRLVIKDQWASHPSREEREASINRFTIQSPIIERSAWELFANVSSLKKEMSAKLYNAASRDLPAVTDEEITEFMTEQEKNQRIQATFLGVYDNRWITTFKADEEKLTSTYKRFDSFFNQANSELIRTYFRNKYDLEQLQAIQRKEIPVDFFEFDDVRYKSKDVGKVVSSLEAEVSAAKYDLEELDKEIFRYYYQLANEAGEGEEFLQLYRNLSDRTIDQDISNEFSTKFGRLLTNLQTTVQWTQVDVDDLCRSAYDLEKQVKNFMREMPENLIKDHFDKPEDVFKYMKTDQQWNHSLTTFSDEGFSKLHMYVASVFSAVTQQMWDATRAIYDRQLALTPPQYVKPD